jgi:hypothetical protein
MEWDCAEVCRATTLLVRGVVALPFTKPTGMPKAGNPQMIETVQSNKSVQYEPRMAHVLHQKKTRTAKGW